MIIQNEVWEMLSAKTKEELTKLDGQIINVFHGKLSIHLFRVPPFYQKEFMDVNYSLKEAIKNRDEKKELEELRTLRNSLFNIKKSIGEL